MPDPNQSAIFTSKGRKKILAYAITGFMAVITPMINRGCDLYDRFRGLEYRVETLEKDAVEGPVDSRR